MMARSSATSTLTSPEPEITEPPKRRGKWKSRLLAVLVIVIVGALAWAAYFSPVLSVRRIEVVGLQVVSEKDVRKALDVPLGIPLLQVDTHAAAKRVANVHKVALVRVQRDYPSAIKVTVTERVAAAYFTAEDGSHIVDFDGVDFATESAPEGIPRLRIDNPVQRDPRVVSAMSVLESLSDTLRLDVKELYAKTPSDVQFVLTDGRRVVWGNVGDSEIKSQVLAALLSQAGRIYDVSSPDLPTIR